MGAMRGGGEGQKALCDVGNAEDEGRSADDGGTGQTEPQGAFSAPRVLPVQLGLDVHLSRSS
ncbi:hypothetical protein DICSQDRAFT_166954 [Dichomitus squalens LYAD-421 SS1]|uniref:uncharacterized protein n=1 Tax=Dichomitus squalens (strain LYAD-421) TaxID=732165 RepID=UPI0004411144|nr:uncharacterized protein DICSQDRAFT_166954 [Dichomitus squalens LYAD-421 SS1]EJF64799.1 hypothetical protein DICSQDRAFT_166954 [Dichomitus squalens LYAD-421 SS1]